MNAAEVLTPAFSLEQNLALFAGPGAGKTHSLVTLCLHLLGGAREDGAAVPTSKLFMLTFTDKAAAEMRARLRHRLEALAQGGPPAEESLLVGSFQRLGRPFPSPTFWRRVRDGLGEATLGTFHSLCVQLLRRSHAGTGTDPAFVLLDEREAWALVESTAEKVVLEALESGDAAVADLCRELGFAMRGRSWGLVGHLCSVFSKIREEGIGASSVPISDERAARSEFDQALESFKQKVKEASGLDRRAAAEFGSVLAACERALDGMSIENFNDPDRFEALRAALDAEPNLARRRNGLGEALKAVKYGALGNGNGCLGLKDYFAGWAVIPQERAFRRLLQKLEARHRVELNRRGVLDFSELLIRTRDLLRAHLGAREAIQRQIRALLVDEFQDTNRLQLEITLLLAEKRAGSPRPVLEWPASLELPLESKLLCAVGDRKQSIYEFRGADVSVFELLARKIESEGGCRRHLRANWRSAPPLVSFFNGAFANLMRKSAEGRDYEVGYEPSSDDQFPARPAFKESPRLDWLTFEVKDSAQACRAQEAELLARRIRQLLSPGAPSVVESDGSLRQARGAEIALLMRRFSFVEVYRQALARHGVPHRIVRGRGFYGAQEVLDVASALSLISDPADSLAFGAVLRSPLVCLSDQSLMKLALAAEGKLSLRHFRQAEAIACCNLPSDERQRLERFLALHRRLRAERDRLGVGALIRFLLDDTAYRLAVAGAPFGEQALANLDKLVELAARWDETGKGGCAAFARELVAMADENPREAQADVVDVTDGRAVQILTIHQAKGLEWPIVFVPDLAAQRVRPSSAIAFDRREGLAIKLWLGGDSDRVRPPRHSRVIAELVRREDAEYLRLLYVALTRARDRLVLSGQTSRCAGTWRSQLADLFASAPSLRSLINELESGDLPLLKPPSPEPVEVTPESEKRVEGVVNRVRSRRPPLASEVVLPVTHLQDYFRCPRRYLYAHRVGLSEFPLGLELESEEEPDVGGGRNPASTREQGIIAHRLLELVDLSLFDRAGEGLQAQLRELLWMQGIDPATADARQVLSWVEAFSQTSFAHRLSNAGADRVHRELPFFLRLDALQGGPSIFLKGQIDLLFEDEEGRAVVIDYKTSARHPAGLAPYDFQLDCYRLAAQQFVKEGVPIIAGVVFLQQKRPEPELRISGAAMELNQLREQIRAAAAEISQPWSRSQWPGRDQPDCASLRCGYQYRCHPQAAGV